MEFQSFLSLEWVPKIIIHWIGGLVYKFQSFLSLEWVPKVDKYQQTYLWHQVSILLIAGMGA